MKCYHWYVVTAFLPFVVSQSTSVLSTPKHSSSPATSPDSRVQRMSSSGAFPSNGICKPHSLQFSAKRRIFDKGELLAAFGLVEKIGPSGGGVRFEQQEKLLSMIGNEISDIPSTKGVPR